MGNINLRIPFCTLDFCQYPRHILGGKIEGLRPLVASDGKNFTVTKKGCQ